MWTSILFNSVDLTTLSGIDISAVKIHNRPKRNVSSQKFARADGSKVTNAEYINKEITMVGTIAATTKANFESFRDTFFRYLNPSEATLRLLQAGSNRDYTATVTAADFTEDPAGGFGEFAIVFLCSNPIGQDTAYTTALNTARTASTFTANLDSIIAGTYTSQLLVTVTLSALTGGTSKYVKIIDPSTGKYMQITRTWTAGDVLVIDAAAKTVKVNGTSVDFTGVFPCLAVGATQLGYDDTLTTRTVTLNAQYKKRYL